MVRRQSRARVGRAGQRSGPRERGRAELYQDQRLVAYGELWADDRAAEVELARRRRVLGCRLVA
jgi:hypothetical protein